MRFALRVFLVLVFGVVAYCVFFSFRLVTFCEMLFADDDLVVNSVLAAFYFGNVTYPSRDPPRMGFLSTVPQDAASQLVSAVAALKTGDNYPCRFLLPPFPLLLLTPVPTDISEVAPSGTFKPAGTASNGVPVATGTGHATQTGSSSSTTKGSKSGAARTRGLGTGMGIGVVVGIVGVLQLWS